MSYKELIHTETIALSNIRLTYIHISHNAVHIKPNSFFKKLNFSQFFLFLFSKIINTVDYILTQEN